MENTLRVRRAEQRVTQLGLAMKARMTQTRVWRIENEYADPTPAEAKALARVLETTPVALFPSLATEVEVTQ